jgi:hypothetical protein
MYEKTLELVQKLEESPNFIYQFIPERTAEAFKLYQKNFK